MCSRKQQNTVRPQAVNLAKAEPCPSPGHGSFFCGPCCSESAPMADPHADETARSPSACGKGSATSNRSGNDERHRIPGHGPAPRSDKTIEAEAVGCATLCANGTGSKGGALVRRCAPPLEDAHRFQKCASWEIPRIPSKMRSLFRRCSIFSEHLRGEGTRP
jgi:hypothetical protein